MHYPEGGINVVWGKIFSPWRKYKHLLQVDHFDWPAPFHSSYLVCIVHSRIGTDQQRCFAVDFTELTVDASQPSQPWMKEIADLDNDGKLDLIVCGRSGPLVWYKNPGWGKTVISTETGNGGSTTGIESGDIDSDGDIDIALANGYWYANPLSAGGDPSDGNWTRSQIGSISTSHDIYFGDLDGDGDVDVVKRDQGTNGNVVRLFRQDAALTWTERQLSAFTGEGLTLGDLDHDSDLDILIGTYWYENSGDIVGGSWTMRQYTTSHTHPDVVVKMGNLDGDAYPDIVVAPAESAGGFENLSWFAGSADPTAGTLTEFVVESNRESVVHSLQLSDIDNDGKQDIIFAEMHQGSNPDDVGALINPGADTAWTREDYSSGGSHNVQAADLDGDGDTDFFGANHAGTSPVKWWRNDSNPSFSLDSWERHVIDDNKPWTSIFVYPVDVNGDARPDIVTGGWWYQNPGLPGDAWSRHVIGTPLNNVATVADFDHDGDLDILGTEGEGSSSNDDFVWARNDGSGSFTVYDNIQSGSGDFLQGAVAANLAPGELHVALSWHQAGNGIGTLTLPDDPVTETWTHQQISTTSQDEDLAAADIDRDGDMDLLLGTKWLKNATSSWEVFTVNSTSGNPDRNELYDMNGDGRVDVVVGFEAISTAGKLAWYEQPADPETSWTEHVIATPIGPMSMDVADMDHDGDPDVVVGEHNLANSASASLIVYENTGSAASWVAHTVYIGDEHHDGARVIDIDLDGDLDIVSIGWSHGRVVLYENLTLTGGVIPDTTPPVIESVIAIGNPVHVKIIFDEEITAESAELVGSYTVSGGIAVIGASLQADGRSVVLTTDALQASISYTVTAQSISDSIGNVSGMIQADFFFNEINLGSGLVAYWPFQEGAGTVTADVSIGGHDGLLSGGAGWTAGIVGNAVDFDGIDDYVLLPSIDLSGDEMTIAAWFRSDDLGNCGASNDCRIISKADGTSEDDHYWMFSTIRSGSATRLRFRLKTGEVTSTLVAESGDITEGEWTHGVAVYDGSEMRLYKDGEPVGSSPKTGSMATNSGIGVNIGRNPDGYGKWKGAIDDVRIYDRALTPAEVGILHTDLDTDSDNDGIDDSWELTWFNNLSTANGTSDFDGDGYSDLMEYLNDLNGESDPGGGEYDPTKENEPGGTGYAPKSEDDGFLLQLLPAILGSFE